MDSTSPPSRVTSLEKRADVLLVDDDKLVLRAIERILVAGGYTVEKVEDGHAAASYAMTGNFDVIISDINMPKISGTELLSVLRNYSSSIPVILITGAPTIESARDAVEYGAIQYLTKPIESETLLRAVSRARQMVRRPFERTPEPAKVASFDRALESLWMAFQPIVSLSAKGPVAYEALVRSREPQFLGPGPLLQYAETYRRLPDLGRTIRGLCARAVEQLPANASLFVNVHVEDLFDEDLFSLKSPLTAHAERVVLEITERGSIDEVNDLLERVRRLRGLGFRLAIDDLGAGYAGLTSVAVLEPDFVKLDMSLTRDLASSPLRKRLVGSMVDACRDTGMRLVAEGVETVHELQALRELGCDLLQGYHFSRPSPDFVRVAA